MVEFFIERKLKKMEDEELVDFYIKNADGMSYNLKKKFVLESTKRELFRMGIENCNVKMQTLPLYMEGVFIEEKNEIAIGDFVAKYFLSTKVFSVITHECTHSYQAKLEKDSPQDPHSIKLEYSRHRNHEEINFCGFHFSDVNMYTSNYKSIAFKENQLAEMFYYLCISEREAFLAGYKREKEICERNEIPFLEYNEVSNQVERFKQRYDCPNFTDSEVFEMIDIAYANLIEGKIPSTDKMGNLCANVMYDLCVVSAHLSGKTSKQQVSEYLMIGNKHENLLKYGYSSISMERATKSLFEEMCCNAEQPGQLRIFENLELFA